MNIHQMNERQLIHLRDQITKKLPDVSTIDLGSESVANYLQLKTLLSEVVDAPKEVSPSKTATLITSINNAMKQLVQFQKELYTVKRQQAFEEAIHKTFEHGDRALRKTFLDLLESELEEI